MQLILKAVVHAVYALVYNVVLFLYIFSTFVMCASSSFTVIHLNCVCAVITFSPLSFVIRTYR